LHSPSSPSADIGDRRESAGVGISSRSPDAGAFFQFPPIAGGGRPIWVPYAGPTIFLVDLRGAVCRAVFLLSLQVCGSSDAVPSSSFAASGGIGSSGRRIWSIQPCLEDVDAVLLELPVKNQSRYLMSTSSTSVSQCQHQK
ncbi:unnamed protein product, partial [Musa acuminata subsp. burmannicoides]